MRSRIVVNKANSAPLQEQRNINLRSEEITRRQGFHRVCEHSAKEIFSHCKLVPFWTDTHRILCVCVFTKRYRLFCFNMAKSLRSKSKRAFRKIKRTSAKSDYAVADALRTQRLSAKLR